MKTPRPDHPRVCGENASSYHRPLLASGSPPRVRGKPWEYGVDFDQYRITPACAGKTVTGGLGNTLKADHPRVCGENMANAVVRQNGGGSPPRVRGKHFGNGVFPWLILVLSLDPL